jgi:hypothetical protein
MHIIGFLLTLCSFGGGLFIPHSQFSSPVRRIATFTPLFGLNELVHFPLAGGVFDWTWPANPAVQPGGLAADFRGRRRLAVPPRHGPGVTTPDASQL